MREVEVRSTVLGSKRYVLPYAECEPDGTAHAHVARGLRKVTSAASEARSAADDHRQRAQSRSVGVPRRRQNRRSDRPDIIRRLTRALERTRGCARGRMRAPRTGSCKAIVRIGPQSGGGAAADTEGDARRAWNVSRLPGAGSGAGAQSPRRGPAGAPRTGHGRRPFAGLSTATGVWTICVACSTGPQR